MAITSEIKKAGQVVCSLLLMGSMVCCQGTNPIEVASKMEVFKTKPEPTNCKANVYFFLQPDCPLSQNYTRPLAILAEDERFQDFCFTAFFSGKFYEKEEFESFILHYDTPYPVKLDPKLKMALSLGATVVPEVFVVNPLGKIVYQGAIDDWAVREGGKGRLAKNHYLEDALVAVAENREPKISKTTAVGCILE